MGGDRPTGDEERSKDEGRSGDERASGDERETDEDAGWPIDGVGGHDGPWTPGILTEIRERPRWRAVALVVAVAIGVAVARVHWLGLFAAGALVGLASRTAPRAVLAGLAVGGVVLVVQVLASPGMDAGEFLALTPPAYVAVAAALALPAWGSLVRGVI